MDKTETVDYRDKLQVLCDHVKRTKGLTRYRLCQQLGIDSGTLANVLAKRRHFSVELLERCLAQLGQEIAFVPTKKTKREAIAEEKGIEYAEIPDMGTPDAPALEQPEAVEN